MLRKFFVVLFLITLCVLIVSLFQDIWAYSFDIAGGLLANLPILVLLSFDVIAVWYLISARSLKFRYLIPLTVVFLTSTMVAIFILATDYVDYRLKDRSYTGIYDNCYKVWGARGLVLEGPDITFKGTQNSIESIQLAFDNGARGTEVDIYFDTRRGEFIVSHDVPYNLKNGAILTLEALFAANLGREYYWLDFKRLRHLDDQQLSQSVAELERLAGSKDLKRRIYVEGEAPFSLAAYRDAGFNTIFDTHPLADSNPLTPTIINIYKVFFYFGDFSVMAMNYGDVDDPIYGARTRQSLGHIPVFIYHVADDQEVLSTLSRLNAVRVILVQNHSLNRYKVNACTPAN